MIKNISIIIATLTTSIITIAQNEIGVWEIKEGTLITNDSLSYSSMAQDYFNTINNTLPKDLIDKYVVSLRLFTDGKDGDLGGLNQMNESVDSWQFDLDTADVNIYSKDSIEILDYTHTLIHEYGHLLTLNPSQIELTDDMIQDDNKGYLTSEGYALKDSYLGIFVKQFWDDELLLEWDNIDNKKNENKRVKLLYEFYLSHRDNFVTDYAAESPEEDIAEAWTFFVLSDKPDTNTVKNQKVIFFYQFPELVEYRQKMRLNIKSIPISYLDSFRTSY
ncbi:hypothetical protein OAC98_00325 [Cyclobacteriaceae bacterium]|jgi:hypothetical protein|nr:hypothetical protein [bacterium]MDB9929835.1 hypothetical protein [Cyclobacteriaceae bacterium]MDC1369676.1 hypothetical protein [Cyclobacteriaceae bacterium]|tara:strand:+ start:81 stop:908 length:828 start_codon:yes stop_codon:yes gene_type:complete